MKTEGLSSLLLGEDAGGFQSYEVSRSATMLRQLGELADEADHSRDMASIWINHFGNESGFDDDLHPEESLAKKTGLPEWFLFWTLTTSDPDDFSFIRRAIAAAKKIDDFGVVKDQLDLRRLEKLKGVMTLS